jgi:hypothetical protein
MKRLRTSRLYVVLAALMIAALVLTACPAPAEPGAAPAPDTGVAPAAPATGSLATITFPGTG